MTYYYEFIIQDEKLLKSDDKRNTFARFLTWKWEVESQIMRDFSRENDSNAWLSFNERTSDLHTITKIKNKTNDLASLGLHKNAILQETIFFPFFFFPNKLFLPHFN